MAKTLDQIQKEIYEEERRQTVLWERLRSIGVLRKGTPEEKVDLPLVLSQDEALVLMALLYCVDTSENTAAPILNSLKNLLEGQLQEYASDIFESLHKNQVGLIKLPNVDTK